MMCEELSGKIYCGYYDIAVMLCEENQDCPEELDEEEENELFDEQNNLDEYYKDRYERSQE
jgi:hypothetical protein